MKTVEYEVWKFITGSREPVQKVHFVTSEEDYAQDKADELNGYQGDSMYYFGVVTVTTTRSW